MQNPIFPKNIKSPIKTSQYDKHHWSIEDFIYLLLKNDENHISLSLVRQLINNEINGNDSNNNIYKSFKESDFILAEEVEIVIGMLRDTIANISQEMSLPIIFWMRISLKIHAKYQTNIDTIIEYYSQWRNNEGKNLKLIHSPEKNKNKSDNILFDIFLLKSGHEKFSEIISISDWRLEEANENPSNPSTTPNKKDQYHGIGKPAYLNLKKIMQLAAVDSRIPNLLPYLGLHKGRHTFHGKRKDLYDILVKNYSLEIAYSSYCRAAPSLVCLCREKCAITPSRILLIKKHKKALHSNALNQRRE